MKTLVILSSILGDRSHSKQLADHLVARVKQAEPAAVITTRDIGAAPLPYFDGATAGALFTPADARTLEQQRIVELSDTLVAELKEADRIVFAVPVYNFNLPAQFKSYLDYVARAGVTFRYTPEGVPEGLVKGKQVFVLTARGGKAEGTPSDTMTPYLRQMLAFLGMTDVTFIAAEGMAMGETAALEGVALARERIDALLQAPASAAQQAA
ncbi:FMN-dependent NADH-azoreductase [Achromobacter deleyi]|uniref:FMN dependent NADH:quinone oxidoreductase n=1 Tax=Achromobacter deleyi TaxID=1353891 RepID=A0A6S6ZXE6_9BURK|nr:MULTISPECIES: NAD(P)H-dependent oxidoreductase [Achromobacter]CAB3690891.1 FMN-dependent NADH-azoreductase [Achromobacter deleyi]CAB3899518.1 FMN-dependent NADH-azoreductase [Achromobacter deleyi]CAB3914212.1 FMN-dependent NADH-azoreductase [Achromobacter deleyi]CAB3922029.1 FMN-dependent NADH-azoreductase [Achromobacter deleyi]